MANDPIEEFGSFKKTTTTTLLKYNLHAIKVHPFKVYIHLNGFAYASRVVKPSPPAILEQFHPPQKKLRIIRHLLPSPLPETTVNLLSDSMDLPALDNPYKWYHKIYGLL